MEYSEGLWVSRQATLARDGVPVWPPIALQKRARAQQTRPRATLQPLGAAPAAPQGANPADGANLAEGESSAERRRQRSDGGAEPGELINSEQPKPARKRRRTAPAASPAAALGPEATVSAPAQNRGGSVEAAPPAAANAAADSAVGNAVEGILGLCRAPVDQGGSGCASAGGPAGVSHLVSGFPDGPGGEQRQAGAGMSAGLGVQSGEGVVPGPCSASADALSADPDASAPPPAAQEEALALAVGPPPCFGWIPPCEPLFVCPWFVEAQLSP